MPPVSRRFLLAGAALAATSLLVPIVVRAARDDERPGTADVEITDWIIIAANGEIS